MLQNRSCDVIRRLEGREVSDAFGDNAPIEAGEILVIACRADRQEGAVWSTLDHQGGNTEPVGG